LITEAFVPLGVLDVSQVADLVDGVQSLKTDRRKKVNNQQ
jgi:hypothetical protein